MNNYSILSKYIVSKYIDRISGLDLPEKLVEYDIKDRVLVGMLSANRMEASLEGRYVENKNTRFESVPSMSLSFLVKKDNKGILYVKPCGTLFYNIEPAYELVVERIVSEYRARDKKNYKDILEICSEYGSDKILLPLTYKKLSIETYIGEGIPLSLKDLKEGSFSIGDKISEKLNLIKDSILKEICICESSYIKLDNLKTEKAFNSVLTIKEEKAIPHWNLDISINVIDEGNCWRLLLQLVNLTGISSGANVGYSPNVFNAGIKIKGNECVEFVGQNLDYFKTGFKKKEPVYAISENTSADFDIKTNTIMTDNVPYYYQNRLITNDEFNQYITFDNLIIDPVKNLEYIYQKMMDDYSKRETERDHTTFLSDYAREQFNDALIDYKCEIGRFYKGIEQIKYKDAVRKAFVYMNKTFKHKLDGDVRTIEGWRLFQIVFIVSLIPAAIRSEYPEDNGLLETDVETADLLYFPTGGGKTEAFLGTCVFAMFFDRLRGKEQGVTSILKYPLRLLAVQQLDRILNIIIKANIIKYSIPQISNTNNFSLGFFVGSSNTPNKISLYEKLSDRGDYGKSKNLILNSDQDTLNEYYRFIDTCPCCGKKMVNIIFDKESWRLKHVCGNPDCSIETLPLMIVDSELYRYLPSVIVSTIDKMSMIGTTIDFKSLFGQVKYKCDKHGYTVEKKCQCPQCSGSLKRIKELKDPVPTFFIQDEMHLVSESLGTFDAHYESFLNYYAKNLIPEQQRKQIRYVGATATISMYEEHIKDLYHMPGRRFPCLYPSVNNDKDYYSYTDNNDISRIILGYAPYGRSILNGMWESVYILRVIVHSIISNYSEVYKELKTKYGFNGSIEEFKLMMNNYWTELVYNNRKQDAIDLENAFNNQANNKLEEQHIPLYKIGQMTSDIDFQSVRKTLFDIHANIGKLDSMNLILATRTISHGVDEDSFNMMYFFGMPNNNAEYIQAYSRTGRKYTGIVIDIIRLMRVRDRSYLKNFKIFHQNKDDLVERVPINRWARNAVYSTLPGLLAGIIYQYYTLYSDKSQSSFMYAKTLKKALAEGSIDINDVISKLISIYGCNSGEKMSLAYKTIITEEVQRILTGIKNNNVGDKEFLSDLIGKYSKGNKKPMTSLRDTEEQIEIKIE